MEKERIVQKMKVLVINAGSSSLKYQLIDMANTEVLAKGLCERIGIDGVLKHEPTGKNDYKAEIAMPTHMEAVKAVLEAIVSPYHGVLASISEVDAVGHRTVHGGEKFASSVIIDDAVLNEIKACVPLAPLHNPANIIGIEACRAVLPGVPMVAVFDTAFHQTMPPEAYIYSIPYQYYEHDKVRRYGFHGTSHFYVSQRAAAMLGKPLEELKLVTCHLGNGSSVCAVDGGKSVDTSMGFTPLDGLPMGTRSGAIDPSILEFLMNKYGMEIEDMLNILNKKSGVLGVSCVSSDFRDLDNAIAEGNMRAKLAEDIFIYNVKKLIGAYAAVMGGVDAVVFTAGVGENAVELRADVVAGLDFMGVSMCPEKNKVRGKETDVSKTDSRARVLVIPTNEELVIATDTAALVGK